MFYWNYSSTRTFFLNEYWIFIPSAILANYVIICKIRLDRKRKKEFKRLIEQIEREKKIRRIILLSLGLSGSIHLLTRGGSDIINTDYIKLKCGIEEGIHYLDDNRLRNIIHDLYRHKARNKMIYITATAVCHLADIYGQTFLALPFAVGDFGFTNVYQTIRKGFVTILLGAVGPLVIIGSPVALTGALMLGTSGLRLAFSNLDLIPTSPVDVTKDVEPRIPGMPDVIVVNNRNRDKITMGQPTQEKQECWLPDQRLLNPNCEVKPSQIPDAIDLVLPDYEKTVNMEDVTRLDRVEFTDKYDLGQTKPSICNPRKGKQVSFLDKFGDSESEPIGESRGWDRCENDFTVPEKRYLRIRNKP